MTTGPRTTHAEAERTALHLLPEVVAELIQRNEQRRRARRTVWRAHVRTAEAWPGAVNNPPAVDNRSVRSETCRRRVIL